MKIMSLSFRYQYAASNPGTHFYHAHTGLNKMDGVIGTLVIRTPREQDPNREFFDTDYSSHVVIISDWMNEESTERFPGRTARGTGPTGQLPDSLLINGKGQTVNMFVQQYINYYNIKIRNVD